jgi:hypothetical protein
MFDEAMKVKRLPMQDSIYRGIPELEWKASSTDWCDIPVSLLKDGFVKRLDRSVRSYPQTKYKKKQIFEPPLTEAQKYKL